MRVRTLTTVILPDESIPAGVVTNLPRSIAEDLLKRGAVEPLRKELVIGLTEKGVPGVK